MTKTGKEEHKKKLLNVLLILNESIDSVKQMIMNVTNLYHHHGHHHHLLLPHFPLQVAQDIHGHHYQKTLILYLYSDLLSSTNINVTTLLHSYK